MKLFSMVSTDEGCMYPSAYIFLTDIVMPKECDSNTIVFGIRIPFPFGEIYSAYRDAKVRRECFLFTIYLFDFLAANQTKHIKEIEINCFGISNEY